MGVEGEVEAELPLDSAGARLQRARETAGLSRAQLSATTKIPERHLAAIEAGDFAALPARTYAVGFSRSYAKALGLNEGEIVQAVREELAASSYDPAPRPVPAFEPGDPGRVPSSRLAWIAALLALVAVVAGFTVWRTYYVPRGSLPSLLPPDQPASPAPSAAPAAVPAASPAAAPAPGGAVVFTALEPNVWVKFYDGTGKQLMQKQMAQGEAWTVPADVPEVRLWTGRPEALAITIGGKAVPKLAEVQRTMKDVPVTAAALLARPAPVPVPASTASPVAGASIAPQPAASPAA